MNKELNTIESPGNRRRINRCLELVKLDDLPFAMVGGGQAAMDV